MFYRLYVGHDIILYVVWQIHFQNYKIIKHLQNIRKIMKYLRNTHRIITYLQSIYEIIIYLQNTHNIIVIFFSSIFIDLNTATWYRSLKVDIPVNKTTRCDIDVNKTSLSGYLLQKVWCWSIFFQTIISKQVQYQNRHGN